MQKSGDPYVHVRVESYRKTLFRLAVRVKVNPDYRSEQVLVAVEQALRSHFSFDTRDFGQPVTLSEVMAVIQAVPGVQAVDVDKLYRYGQEAKLNPILAAAVPQAGTHATVSAAELLTLDPGPLDDLGVIQ
jgi:phage-related baseplate assembly protein